MRRKRSPFTFFKYIFAFLLCACLVVCVSPLSAKADALPLSDVSVQLPIYDDSFSVGGDSRVIDFDFEYTYKVAKSNGEPLGSADSYIRGIMWFNTLNDYIKITGSSSASGSYDLGYRMNFLHVYLNSDVGSSLVYSSSDFVNNSTNLSFSYPQSLTSKKNIHSIHGGQSMAFNIKGAIHSVTIKGSYRFTLSHTDKVTFKYYIDTSLLFQNMVVISDKNTNNHSDINQRLDTIIESLTGDDSDDDDYQVPSVDSSKGDYTPDSDFSESLDSASGSLNSNNEAHLYAWEQFNTQFDEVKSSYDLSKIDGAAMFSGFANRFYDALPDRYKTFLLYGLFVGLIGLFLTVGGRIAKKGKGKD